MPTFPVLGATKRGITFASLGRWPRKSRAIEILAYAKSSKLYKCAFIWRLDSLLDAAAVFVLPSEHNCYILLTWEECHLQNKCILHKAISDQQRAMGKCSCYFRLVVNPQWFMDELKDTSISVLHTMILWQRIFKYFSMSELVHLFYAVMLVEVES